MCNLWSLYQVETQYRETRAGAVDESKEVDKKPVETALIDRRVCVVNVHAPVRVLTCSWIGFNSSPSRSCFNHIGVHLSTSRSHQTRSSPISSCSRSPWSPGSRPAVEH